MEREETGEASTTKEAKTDLLKSLVDAARRVDVRSLLLHVNVFLLQQQRQLQPPYFMPASPEEDKLQLQLLQCRQTLLQLLKHSAATAAAGAAVAAAIPGRSYHERDTRPLIFNQSTAETWNDLLQDLRKIVSLLKEPLQSRQPTLSATAAAAVEELLDDIDAALSCSRSRKRECRRQLQEWQQQKGGKGPQAYQIWSQHQRMQQQQQRQQVHLVQNEVRALKNRLKELRHPKGIESKRSGEAPLQGNAAMNTAGAVTAANKHTANAIHHQRSTEESYSSSDGSSLSSSSGSSSDSSSSDSKHSSKSSNGSKASPRSDESSRNSSSSDSSKRSSSSSSKESSGRSSKSSSSSSGSDSDSHAAVEPVRAISGAAKVAGAPATPGTPVPRTARAEGKQKRLLGNG
ncbi:uncharacterized protein EMH_0059570 [Eimeria mitis]|uniref:Uncharacterized protein n=1 Tax=Eimeria mitis TaxID=44415 RepID=U6K808_9EIME|nr:uncharacterized protein EMH_0059570 [Eimeria mitis]CDJ34094.1 hypothetical protein, conserved [Eimeria mitis]